LEGVQQNIRWPRRKQELTLKRKSEVPRHLNPTCHTGEKSDDRSSGSVRGGESTGKTGTNRRKKDDQKRGFSLWKAKSGKNVWWNNTDSDRGR